MPSSICRVTLLAALVVGAYGCSGTVAHSGPPGGGSCKPTTCAAVGAPCGSIPNGCGGTLSCGTCPPGSGTGMAAQVALRLGRPTRFLVGMGNDLASDHNYDGAYTLGTTLDLHYCYLVGLAGQGGWPDWNAGGTFVDIMADTADSHGVIPMFTLYSMAAQGEDNMAALTTDSYMQAYWDGAKLLFQRLGVFGKPALVHLEPDFWAFAQQHTTGNDPTTLPVHVSALAPDCAGQPDNLKGMAGCLLQLARLYAPKAAVGFHVSTWGGDLPSTIAFFQALGISGADLVVTDVLDRDAGCYEAATDPNCQRSGGPWYWDETNQTHPNFHDSQAWAQAIAQGLNKPILWWQVPFGVPSATPGGTAGYYRDNRVDYLFKHISEFVSADFLGATFGTGAANQTYITTDNGQFQNAVQSYYAGPVPLP